MSLLQVFELLVGEVLLRGGAEAAAGVAWRGGTAAQPGRGTRSGRGSAVKRGQTGLSPGRGQARPRQPRTEPSPPSPAPRSPGAAARLQSPPAARRARAARHQPPSPIPAMAAAQAGPAPAGRRHRLLHRGGRSEPWWPLAGTRERGARPGCGACRHLRQPGHTDTASGFDTSSIYPALPGQGNFYQPIQLLRHLKAPKAGR